MTNEQKGDTKEFWENQICGSGNHFNRYPYDQVIRFIYRNYPRNKERKNVRVLEMGSGAGNNLWFASREGFSVTGIEGSSTAVEFARKRFADENLDGNFVVGDFTNLPFENNFFEITVDRAFITCCGWEDTIKAVCRVHCVLVPGGKFFFNAYSDRHPSFASGPFNTDGTIVQIERGSLKCIRHIYFYSHNQIKQLFHPEKWKTHQCQHIEINELERDDYEVPAKWLVIAEKICHD